MRVYLQNSKDVWAIYFLKLREESFLSSANSLKNDTVSRIRENDVFD